MINIMFTIKTNMRGIDFSIDSLLDSVPIFIRLHKLSQRMECRVGYLYNSLFIRHKMETSKPIKIFTVNKREVLFQFPLAI